MSDLLNITINHFEGIIGVMLIYVSIFILFIKLGSRRRGMTWLGYLHYVNQRNIRIWGHVIKEISYDTKRIYYNNYIDSLLINITYGFALALFGGWVIYITNIVYKMTIYESLFILISYFIIETRMLFYIDAIKDPDHLTSWRSIPTVGIIASTPVVFLYVLSRKRSLDQFSLEGLLNVWATTRYNVLNPRWLKPSEDSKIIVGGSREKSEYPLSRHSSWIYKWISGVIDG